MRLSRCVCQHFLLLVKTLYVSVDFFSILWYIFGMKNFYCRYAELALKFGVNIQKGQRLEILCPTEREDFALILVETAYKLGAKTVNITWENQKVERLNFLYAKTEDLCAIPKWLIEQKNAIVEDGACYICVDAEDPNAFSGLDEEKISAYITAKAKALKNYKDAVMSNGIRWCVISAPTKIWADTVFEKDDNSFEKLTSAIATCMRIDNDDHLSVWEKHVKKLASRADFLNEQCFSSLHFSSANGTDLTVGLADGHIWTSAMEKAKDGIDFVANLPTEEIFTAPHCYRVDGVVKSALPLALNGNIVDDFTLRFKDGEVVEYSAKKGYETLKRLIETDEGNKRIGEVALIDKNSPIKKTGVMFYNTLFDENASCHLALGKAYPTTVKGGTDMSASELKKVGLNDSVEHIDFMFGTDDLSVVGIKENGDKVPLFKDGEWLI